jgi:predicted nucleic acid-binding protein
MRIVLDTNVLVTAAPKQKSTPGMTTLVVERRGVLLKSLASEQQLFEVLARPYFDSLIDPEARAAIIWIETTARQLSRNLAYSSLITSLSEDIGFAPCLRI